MPTHREKRPSIHKIRGYKIISWTFGNARTYPNYRYKNTRSFSTIIYLPASDIAATHILRQYINLLVILYFFFKRQFHKEGCKLRTIFYTFRRRFLRPKHLAALRDVGSPGLQMCRLNVLRMDIQSTTGCLNLSSAEDICIVTAS